MNEDRAERYHRQQRRAAAAQAIATAAALLAVIASGLNVSLRDAAATPLSGLGPSAQAAVTAAICMGLLVGALEVAALPFRGRREQTLARRYGLAHEPFAQWLRSTLAAGAIAAVGAAGVAGVATMAARRWPDYWWAALALAAIALTLGAAAIAPRLAIGSRDRRRPDDGAAKERLARLRGRAGVGDVELWSAPAWRRAGPLVAFAGGGRRGRVFVSDDLLRGCSEGELDVVLAHELGHYVHGDVWISAGVDAARMLGCIAAIHGAVVKIGPALGVGGPADAAAAPLALLAAGVVWVATMPAATAAARALERRADRFALGLTGAPEAFETVARRVAAQNLIDERPSALPRWFFHRHPTLAQRIADARSFSSPAENQAVRGKRA